MCVPKSRRLGFHHRPAGPNDYLGCVTRAQVHVLSLQRDSTRPVVRSLGWDLRNRDAIINEPSGAIIFASPTDWGGLRHPGTRLGKKRDSCASGALSSSDLRPLACMEQSYRHPAICRSVLFPGILVALCLGCNLRPATGWHAERRSLLGQPGVMSSRIQLPRGARPGHFSRICRGGTGLGGGYRAGCACEAGAGRLAGVTTAISEALDSACASILGRCRARSHPGPGTDGASGESIPRKATGSRGCGGGESERSAARAGRAAPCGACRAPRAAPAKRQGTRSAMPHRAAQATDPSGRQRARNAQGQPQPRAARPVQRPQPRPGASRRAASHAQDPSPFLFPRAQACPGLTWDGRLLFTIPEGFVPGMRVPAAFYANRDLLRCAGPAARRPPPGAHGPRSPRRALG